MCEKLSVFSRWCCCGEIVIELLMVCMIRLMMVCLLKCWVDSECVNMFGWCIVCLRNCI